MFALQKVTSWSMLKSESLAEKINDNNVCSSSPSYSMNTSKVNLNLSTDMYDYDYNSTCDQDLNPVLSDTVLRLFYCVVFSFGLIGKFNPIQSFKFEINNS